MLKRDDEIIVNTWLLLLLLFTTLLLGFEFGKRVYKEGQLIQPEQIVRFGRNGGPSFPPTEPEAPPLYRVIWDLISGEDNEE